MPLSDLAFYQPRSETVMEEENELTKEILRTQVAISLLCQELLINDLATDCAIDEAGEAAAIRGIKKGGNIIGTFRNRRIEHIGSELARSQAALLKAAELYAKLTGGTFDIIAAARAVEDRQEE